MANRLNFYNPQFYANEALIWLQNRRGMYPRVYRAFERERRAFQLGDTINIRKPARFAAANAPNSAYQDLKTGTMQISLTNFKEVPFVVPDTEIAFGGQRLIDEHIGPAADALGDSLDQFLYALAANCPHTIDLPGSVASTMPATLASIRRIMVDNQVPPDGRPLHYLASPTTVERCLGSSAFTQWQGAGPTGAEAQASGTLGRKFGFDFFESQNGPTIQADSVSSVAGTLTTPAGTKNDTTISLNTSGAQSAVMRKGMTVTIVHSDGSIGKYSVTADTAASGNNWPNVPISPRLRQDVTNGATWAFVATSALAANLSYRGDLVFHPNAIAVCTVPLPEHGSDMGARVYTAQDPQTGLSLRARLWFDSRNAQVGVILDMLFGGAMIDPDLAVRGIVRA